MATGAGGTSPGSPLPLPADTLPWGPLLLSRLADPAVTLLLLTLGVNAILVEFAHPGGYVPGVVGVLALALGFYGLGVLDANLLGLAFLAVAFALFALEVKVPTHGALAAVGIVLFVVGGAVLFAGGPYAIPWVPIALLAVASAAVLAFVVNAARRAMHRQPTTGTEGLVGARAVVVEDLAPTGRVRVQGEIWAARTVDGAQVPRGAEVLVVRRDAFLLYVRRPE
jgi:membrane-bound serine protease (ClpP class)